MFFVLFCNIRILSANSLNLVLCFQISWSADSRLLCSGSSDSTLKVRVNDTRTLTCVWNSLELLLRHWLNNHLILLPLYSFYSSSSHAHTHTHTHTHCQVWDIKQRKLLMDLPGHADEVFSVDWSPDGDKVASGGRDRMLKL